MYLHSMCTFTWGLPDIIEVKLNLSWKLYRSFIKIYETTMNTKITFKNLHMWLVWLDFPPHGDFFFSSWACAHTSLQLWQRSNSFFWVIWISDWNMSNLTRHALKDILKSGSYLTDHIMPHFIVCLCNIIGEMRE